MIDRMRLIATLAAVVVLTVACGDDGPPAAPTLPTFPAEQVTTKRLEVTPTAEPSPTAFTSTAVPNAGEIEAEPFNLDIPTRERIEIQRAIDGWTADIEKDPENV